MISSRDFCPGSFHLYDADVSWLMLACVLLVTFYSNFSCLLGLNQSKIKACCDINHVLYLTDVTVKNVLLQSVKQTKADTLEATIAGDTKTIKEADITVTNTTTNVVYPVKKVSVDSKDATKVTLTVFSGLTDGKEYNVTLDGVTKSFVATDGTVADVTVDKTTVPYATETTIKLVATDAQGIVLTEADYGTQDLSKYDFSITTNNGYVNGSKLYLNKVGDTATAEVTYKTGKYGEDGKPVGNIGPKKITITAVEQAAINNYDVRIGKGTDKEFAKAKDTKTIAVGETTNNVAYFMIKDADNKEVSNYYDYTVESSDTAVLMIQSGSSLGTTKSVVLVPVKAGTSYLLIKKNNAIVYSIPITVVAERVVATMTVDKTSASVSNAIDKPVKVTASFKDQYSDDIAVDGGVKVTCLSTTAKDKKPADVTEDNGYFSAVDYTNKSKPFVLFKSKDITEGTYVYKIAYEKDGKEVCARTVTINVQKPGDAGKSTVSFALNMGETSVDAVVDNNYTADKNFTISVAELLGNVVKDDALAVDDKLHDNTDPSKGTKVISIDYVITKDGKPVIDTVKAVTDSAITVDANVITVNVTKKGVDNVVARLATGTYNVTATIKTLADGKTDPKDYVTKTISNAFVITDTTPSGTVSIENEKADADKIEKMVAAAIKYSYGEKSYGANADNTLSVVYVEGTSNGATTKINKDNSATASLEAGQIVNVTKVVVKVEVKTGVYVTQEITTPFKVTAK